MLAVKQLRKKSPPPGQEKHHASEGVVVVGIGVGVWIPFETLKRQLTSRGKTPCFGRIELVPKPRQKTA